MPIAELLGVQFDMHLLLKLSLSVAAVLLGSWAYRFYGSRDKKETQLSVEDDKETGEVKCQNCKTTLRGRSSRNHDTGDGGEGSTPLHKHSDNDDFISDTEISSDAPLCDHEQTEGGGEESKSLHKDSDNDDPVSDAEISSDAPLCDHEQTEDGSEGSTPLHKDSDNDDPISDTEMSSDAPLCDHEQTEDGGEGSTPLHKDSDHDDPISDTEMSSDVPLCDHEQTEDGGEGSTPLHKDSDNDDQISDAEISSDAPLCDHEQTEDGGEGSTPLHKESDNDDPISDTEMSSDAPLCDHEQTEDDGEESTPLHKDPDDDELISDTEMSSETPLCESEQTEDALSVSCSDQNINMKEEMLPLQKEAEDATRNISFGSALNLPHPTESGMASTTGRRSPCFLQKLEGSVGVGRELRQDLERQGAYSSFLSKAEIKVEDANVVLEGKEDPVVRGKIYDYYVESSSHSVIDSNTVLGQFERKSESQPGEFRSCNAESPTSLSPIIMRDLVLPLNAAEDPSTLQSPDLKHPARPALLRKESYLSAAEQSELPVASLTSGSTSRMTHSLTSAGDEAITVYHMILSSTENDGREEGDLETVAGAPFLHLPALEGTDLESLKSKLDLGNCLETLCLAKKHGPDSVLQAALGVMSDNYLQVLMDPNLYGRLMAGEREQIRKQRMRGRRFLMVADMNPQDWAQNTGGQTAETEQRRTSSAVYYYDDYKGTWHTLCPIPQEVISKACAMCTMDNYLFVAVGCQGTDRDMTPSKQVFCYNPLTSIWKEISPMNEARPRCKLAALEGYIYAIGGECLSSVERYDPRLDRWTFVAPLPNDTFAVAHHVTVCNGELFVSGGTLKYMLLRYNPKTDTWRPSVMVASKDRTADLIAVGRFLYRFDVNPRLGISVYRYHTVARLWYECSSRRIQHCPAFQCVKMDNTVYCVSRQFTMQFRADEISPAFIDEDLSVLSAAKGILFPFVLSLPDKKPRQTSV
ncbi:kelch domain-containing protein 7A [Notolabrus celidotus]|uniref:kelch domain-containing protein 7A n=1 Tax=Notolabrus celidotus TaxID=1203425 RepID=UPI00148F677B|nr:kelch domain-containing protein 7A [Notolabrus celidotus]